ncbi:MAG: prepilin-type N-terminal cleavage/methylation domain-containing protein [Armatimonadetes bacterium]|nr:prepilin-type N-terminal cleavage/methylation domain-containing protein [Armatimonadota bacterium]
MSKRKGFSLIELLVVIGIIAILAAILFPMLTKVQDRGKQTKCLSNMRQLSLAITNYVQDAIGALPDAWTSGDWHSGTWRERLHPYLKSKKIFDCATPTYDWRDKLMSKFSHYGLAVGLTHVGMSNPGFLVPTNGPFGYTYLSKIQQPSKTIMVAENKDGDWSAEPMTSYGGHWDSGAGDPGGFYPYHLRQTSNAVDYTGGGNFIFCDTHVRFMFVNEAEGYDPVTKKRSFSYWVADKSYNLLPKQE